MFPLPRINLGGVTEFVTGRDWTPNLNITRNAGGGIPFVERNTRQSRAPAPTTGRTRSDTSSPSTLTVRDQPYDYANDSYGGTDGYGGQWGGSGGGGGVDTSAQERAAALFGIDQQLKGAEFNLGELDRQRDIGYGNIDREYQYEYDLLTGNRRKNLDRYGQQEVNQLNEYQSNRSNNNMNASNWLMGARNVVGSQGAGGGSTARYRLPYEAQTQAAAANSGAQSINNQNMQAIAGSRQQDEDQFVTAERDLGRQRDLGRRDFDSQIKTNRAAMEGQIGSLRGQRAIAEGGDFRTAQAAAAPYTSRVEALLSEITGLARQPDYQPQQITLGRPDLSGYNWARPDQAPMPRQDPSQGPNIIRRGEEEQRRNPIAALFGLDEQYA